MRETANEAVETTLRLSRLFETDRNLIRQSGRRAISALQVHQVLMAHPILSLSDAGQRSQLSFRVVSATMRTLVDLGIVREITGQRRNRLFAYDQYLSILSEGTEPL